MSLHILFDWFDGSHPDQSDCFRIIAVFFDLDADFLRN